jgi:hypothetical protein
MGRSSWNAAVSARQATAIGLLGAAIFPIAMFILIVVSSLDPTRVLFQDRAWLLWMPAVPTVLAAAMVLGRGSQATRFAMAAIGGNVAGPVAFLVSNPNGKTEFIGGAGAVLAICTTMIVLGNIRRRDGNPRSA